MVTNDNNKQGGMIVCLYCFCIYPFLPSVIPCFVVCFLSYDSILTAVAETVGVVVGADALLDMDRFSGWESD